MIEGMVFEYLLNALWQLPLLLLGAWLIIRIARPPLLAQHLLWLFTLLAAVVLPARGYTAYERPAPPQAALTANAPERSFERVTSFSADSDPFPRGPSPMPARAKVYLALHIGLITIGGTVVHITVIAYALVVGLCLMRLLRSCLAALKLRAKGLRRPLTSLESHLLTECARRIGLSPDRLPEIRSLAESHASPMIIGIRKPVLLIPEFLRHSSDPGFEDQHLIAVLTHELTHVRRRDSLVNLIAQAVSIPVAWHPAVIAMHDRIRQTREMICDEQAARVFPASTHYARSLLALAESIIQPHPTVEAVSLFDRNRKTLEERIMRLTEPQLRVPLATRVIRIAAGVAVLLAFSTAAATLHLKPAAPTVYAAHVDLQTAAPAVSEAVFDEPGAQTTSGQSSPAAEPVTVQTRPPAQTPATATAPAAAPVTAVTPEHRVYLDGQSREMTSEERERFDRQLDAMHAQISSALSRIDTAKLQQQIDAANLKALNTPEFKQRMEDLKQDMERFNTPEYRAQFAGLSVELKKQLADLKVQLDSPEFHEKLKLNMPLVVVPNLDSLGQIDRDSMRLNKADFKRRVDAAREQLHLQLKEAGSDSDKIQKAMDQFNKEVDAATGDLTRAVAPAPPAHSQPPAVTP